MTICHSLKTINQNRFVNTPILFCSHLCEYTFEVFQRIKSIFKKHMCAIVCVRVFVWM